MSWAELRERLWVGLVGVAMLAVVVGAFNWFASTADSAGTGRMEPATGCGDQPDAYATDTATQTAYDEWLRCAYPNVPSWRPPDPQGDLREERWLEMKDACRSIKGSECADAEVDQLLNAPS
ncbi:hypothetical protein H9L10_07115 [Phycicoccus endophyticus]|uniref:Uncharacterized protein n=1 Tax=Phycicoccus endophyticus TaxID=1690220 RepID=A0A7G9R526_9MICO|nr:hypothetical protein [Phycicoccus endophyticus]NHI20886.1 hypothetical protein [Phycicoccus endophyticus]QNN50701.1 hypothetical protein H9L10_07115 [Phycicoccus endophyticus]GGL22187.1 hypothetical protein GCM10012283_00310 [Phycicoccus endophyticus]